MRYVLVLVRAGEGSDGSIPFYGGGYPIFIVALVLFPHSLGGKGFHNGQFERGQEVHLILKKGGLRLQIFWS